MKSIGGDGPPSRSGSTELLAERRTQWSSRRRRPGPARAKEMPSNTHKQPRIVLTEYSEEEVELSIEQERILRHLVRDRLTIVPTDTLGRWRVKASSYV